MWVGRNRDRDRDRDAGAPKPTSFAINKTTASGSRAAAGGSTSGGGKRTREVASRERVAELRRMPTGWRTLRWVMMKRQAELKSQAAEAAAMYSEEMEQRLKERCVCLVDELGFRAAGPVGAQGDRGGGREIA